MAQENLPNFVRPFDGTQSEIESRERELVATRFSSFVDDLLLNHVEAVKHFSNEESVLLEREFPDAVTWSISVRSVENNGKHNEFPPSECIVKSIDMQRIVGPFGREMIGYRLFQDGIVRRWDGGDKYGKRQQERALGIDPELQIIRPEERMSIDGILEVVQKNMDYLVGTALPNQRLERSMGINEQPISLAELDGVIDFVSAPTFQSVSYFD